MALENGLTQRPRAESFYGLIEPARDYSVYDMSWAGTAGAMVSTMNDLNDFYRQLLGGKLNLCHGFPRCLLGL